MVNVTHIQYPVGQGGLHLGIIGNVAYIYDCGCSTQEYGERFLNDIITKLNICSHVYVFISHFHFDHCSLLPDLIHKLKVGYTIYAPYIKDKLETILLLYNLWSHLEPNKFEFYFNLVVNQIEEFGVKDDVIVPFDNENFILDGYVLHYDKTISKTMLKTLSPLENVLHNVLSFVEWVRNYQHELEELIKHNFHYTMLCLYAGEQCCVNYSKMINYYTSPVCRNLCCNCCCNQCFSVLSGWLHTGDAQLKGISYKLLTKHYNKYICSIGMVQIPHHGSSSYINAHFMDCFLINNPSKPVVFYLTGNMFPKTKKEPKRNHVDLFRIRPRFEVTEEEHSEIITVSI